MSTLRAVLLLSLLAPGLARAQARGPTPVEVEVSLERTEYVPGIIEGLLSSHAADGGDVAVTYARPRELVLRGPEDAVQGLRRLLDAIDAPAQDGAVWTVLLWGGRVGVIVEGQESAARYDAVAKRIQERPPEAWEEAPSVSHDRAVQRLFAIGTAEALAALDLQVDPNVARARAVVIEDAGPERRVVRYTPRRARGPQGVAALQATLADALAGAQVELGVEDDGALRMAGPAEQVQGLARLADALDDPLLAERAIALWTGRVAVVLPATRESGPEQHRELSSRLALGAGPMRRGQAAVVWSSDLLRLVVAGAPRDMQKLELPLPE